MLRILGFGFWIARDRNVFIEATLVATSGEPRFEEIQLFVRG